ncbi:MAG: hypothetical protein KBS93_05325 [Flavobacteriaceae bacterium]|nr:hypothetical protein [Candidatus Onthonaster equi]
MKKLASVRMILGLFLFILISCGKTILPNDNKEDLTLQNLETEGKWIDNSKHVKVYFEDELEKIVLTDGCQIVSANYKKFYPAISFTDIIFTQKTCNNILGLDQILKQTKFIQAKSINQMIFLNENKEELLVIRKF